MPPPNREPRTFKTFELVDEVDSEESRQINGMRGGLPSGANQGIPTAYPKSTIPRETEHRMGVIWPDMKPTVFDTRYSPAPMISVDQYLERTRRPDLGSLGNLFRDWLHCAERQAEASQRVTTTPAPAGRKRMSADKARVKAEQYVTRHGFPGVNKLADDVGCSPATIRNAISNSEKLQTAKAESDLKKTPSGRGGTGDYAQSPEANLVGAERLRELLGYASPDDRAKLNAPNMATRLGGMTHDEYNAILQSVKEKNAEASEDA